MANSAQRRKSQSLQKQELTEEVAALKREKILAAATALFSAKGYLGTSLHDIAVELGLTKQFIYYRFETKQEILGEICELGARDALAAATRAISGRDTPTVRLKRFVREYTAGAVKTQRSKMIYFREQLHLSPAVAARIAKMRKEVESDVRDLLLEGIKVDEFQCRDAHVSALAIIGMCTYAFNWYREEPLSAQSLADAISDLVLQMVTKQP
jgi:TetR/AcrR family transcriptional regulator, cholesterol catabolism regulator